MIAWLTWLGVAACYWEGVSYCLSLAWKRSKLKIWSMVSTEWYDFCTIVQLKTCQLNHSKSGTICITILVPSSSGLDNSLLGVFPVSRQSRGALNCRKFSRFPGLYSRCCTSQECLQILPVSPGDQNPLLVEKPWAGGRLEGERNRKRFLYFVPLPDSVASVRAVALVPSFLGCYQNQPPCGPSETLVAATLGTAPLQSSDQLLMVSALSCKLTLLPWL